MSDQLKLAGQVWSPTTDPRSTLVVIEEMRKRGFVLSVTDTAEGYCVTFQRRGTEDVSAATGTAIAKALLRAVSEAALSALTAQAGGGK